MHICYYVPGAIVHVHIHLDLAIIPYVIVPFYEGSTEAQGGEVTCPVVNQLVGCRIRIPSEAVWLHPVLLTHMLSFLLAWCGGITLIRKPGFFCLLCHLHRLCTQQDGRRWTHLSLYGIFLESTLPRNSTFALSLAQMLSHVNT